MPIENLKSEIYRKIIHLSSMWVPALLLIKGKQITLNVTFILLVAMGLFEGLRRKNTFIRKIVEKYSLVFRASELKGEITGASYFLLACFLVIFLFPTFTAVLSLFVLIISDSMAAIIGKKWGKIKFNNKTLEGSIAFFTSSLIISILGVVITNNSGFSIATIIISCFGTTIFELFAKNLKVDDNLLIPLSFASLMQILS
jgi:dolichol kinase